MDTNNSHVDMCVNGTGSVVVVKLAALTHAINILIAGFTALLNTTVLVCLKTHRKDIPVEVWYQLLNLTIGDLISGVSFGLFCMPFFSFVNTSTAACGAILVLGVSSQYATLLNVSVLSFRRWKIIRRLTQPSVSEYRNKYTWLFASMASIFCHLPVLVFVTKNPYVNGCFSVEFFDIPAAVAFNPVLSLVTLFVVDGIYCHVLILLSKKYTNGAGMIYQPDHNIIPIDSVALETNSGCNRTVQDTALTTKVFQEHDSAPSRRLHRNESGKAIPINSLQAREGNKSVLGENSQATLNVISNCRPVDEFASGINEFTPNAAKTSIHIPEDMEKHSRRVKNVRESSAITPRQGPRSNPIQRLHQQRARKVLLTALITVNIATLSYIAICLYYVFKTDEMPSVAMLDFQAFALNSLLNPIVYSFQVREIRTAIKANIARVLHSFTGLCTP